MSDIPVSVVNSGLWQTLTSQASYVETIKTLRGTAEAIAQKIAELIPDYTDHSVDHMDGLWPLADQAFKKDEIRKFTTSEVFILGCSFYIHDLAMALAATKEGCAELKDSVPYKSAFKKLKACDGFSDPEATSVALRIAARELHASKAEQLADSKLPGIDRYLLEPTSIRNECGNMIGKVTL